MRRLLFALGLVAGGVLGVRAVRNLGGDKSQPSEGVKTFVYEAEQAVDAPLDRVFAFFSEPRNLAELTPGWMGFEILAVENLPMQAGTAMEYRIRLGPVPQRWRTEIVEFEAGRRFVDLQTKGPYRYWRHEHSFEEHNGGTLVRDRVEYQLPLGALGAIAGPALVRRSLDQIFAYRSQAIERIFGSG